MIFETLCIATSTHKILTTEAQWCQAAFLQLFKEHTHLQLLQRYSRHRPPPVHLKTKKKVLKKKHSITST